MNSLTRRRLIHLVGRAGGVAAAYRTMAAMGLLAVPAAYAGPPDLPPGEGKKVVILGAGICGMVAALELDRAGYACTVLEARDRPGGRNWSLRGGDRVQATDGTQHVAWDTDEQLYFNPGPGRLPFHHQGILSYCRELRVPVEVMCNDNRAAFMQDDQAFGGAPQRNSQVVNDSRGAVAELAAKAVSQELLDKSVTSEDAERLRGFLRSFGALDQDLVYRGSARAGYAVPPGAGTQAGKLATPLDFRAILASKFWHGPLQFAEQHTQAATMMQPVGGMGRIGQAFGAKLGNVISYNSEVIQMRREGDGARIVVRDTTNSTTRSLTAERVICTIPFPVLRKLDADFSAPVKAAMDALYYVPAGKIAFQAARRFWELDQQIYGGISWTGRDITQIWYPTAGLHRENGILVGAYIWSDRIGHEFAAKTPSQRAEAALDDGERLHPGYRTSLAAPVSVAWPNIPYSGAGWAEWERETRAEHYPVLLAGDGPFRFAGEHMSYVTGWQEGAVLSAHVAIAAVAADPRATGP